MTAGRLASAKPAATTNTTLFSCPVGYAATVVVNACNQSSTATTYRVALRNYTQILTLSGSSHTFNLGNPLSSYRLTISPGVSTTTFLPGSVYTDTNKKWSFKILDVFKDTSVITIPTKVARVGTLSYTSISPALSTFVVGNTITDSTNGLTALILGLGTGQISVQLEALSTSATTLKLASAPAYVTAGYAGISNYAYTVTNSGAASYTFSGSATGSNPTLNVVQGDVLTFNVNASGHPLWIKTAATTGTGSGVTTGVITNNGTQSGTVTWNTSGVTPGTYYYICQFHSSMVGTINIVAPGALTYLAIPNAQPPSSYEIVKVNAWTSATYTATIVRAQQGTAAAVIPVGANASMLTVTTTTKTINEGAVYSATDTSLTLNNVTNLFTGDYLKVGSEFLIIQTVDTGTSTVTVQRAQLSSTATTHNDGATVTRVSNDGSVYVNYFGDTPTPSAATLNYTVTANGTSDFVFSGSATGNDPAITVNVGDTLVFALTTPGQPMRISTQQGTWNIANDATGVTTQGTSSGTMTWVTTGLPAGLYYYVSENSVTMQGVITIQTPPTTPTITSAGVTARITSSPTTYSSSNEFIHDTNGDGIYEWVTGGYTMNLGRIYKFTQTDTTNTAHPFRISDQVIGTPLYTTGVTTSGTPGTSGSFTQIDLTASSPTVLYSVSSTSGETSYGSQFTINSDPLFTDIFVYDVSKQPTVADTFTSGITTTTTQTISAINPGPYGYVQGFSGTSLKVALGINSSAFSSTTTTITGTSGQSTITVGSATGLIPGMIVSSGTGVATGAKIYSVSGTTVTLDLANTGAVSGNGVFNHTFLDTPLTPAAVKTRAVVSSFTDIDDADYILYDKALSGNTTDKNTGIVVGPGSSVMVYSTLGTISYVVNGFVDVTNDWATVQYSYTTTNTP